MKKAANLAEKKPPFQTLNSHIDWSCRWYRVRKDAIRLPDGAQGEYNVLEMEDSVWVVPITTEGEVVLIYNYRYPLKAWCWEVPAGHIDAGQTPEEAAQAELLQEAGGQAESFQLMVKLSTLNGIGDHYGYFYLARGVRLGDQQQEQTEAIEVKTFPLSEAIQMARSSQINDAASVMALLLAEPLIRG